MRVGSIQRASNVKEKSMMYIGLVLKRSPATNWTIFRIVYIDGSCATTINTIGGTISLSQQILDSTSLGKPIGLQPSSILMVDSNNPESRRPSDWMQIVVVTGSDVMYW